MSVWDPYEPNDRQPWNARRVVHLHRRCVFGPSGKEVARDLAADPQEAVTRLLNGTCRAEGTPRDFEQLSDLIGQSAVGSASADRLKAWWVYRMLFTADPLRERLTLMWHNHFATSNLKVAELSQMKSQNETLRRRAFGPFGETLNDMIRDPALLRWLDAPTNRKGHANENLARELMELFTLGVGHYTETDVSEAARALTGWTVRNERFFESPKAHDAGRKSVLNKVGAWNGQDLVDILLDHPATAQRIVWRLLGEFFGEGVVDETAANELADGLRKHDLDVGWAVETMLRSHLFFADQNIASRVCDPATFLIAPLRVVEFWRRPPSTLVLAEWLSRFGQDLFYPPNVGGWSGGRAWLSTRGVIARAKYSSALANGDLSSPPSPPKLGDLVNVPQSSLADQVQSLGQTLFGVIDDQTVKSVCTEATNVASETHGNALNTALIKLLTDSRAHLN